MPQSINICMKRRWTSKKHLKCSIQLTARFSSGGEMKGGSPEGTHGLQRKKEVIAWWDLERIATKACRAAYSWESASPLARWQEGMSSVSDLHLVNVKNSPHQVLQINREPCRVPPIVPLSQSALSFLCYKSFRCGQEHPSAANKCNPEG